MLASLTPTAYYMLEWIHDPGDCILLTQSRDAHVFDLIRPKYESIISIVVWKPLFYWMIIKNTINSLSMHRQQEHSTICEFKWRGSWYIIHMWWHDKCLYAVSKYLLWNYLLQLSLLEGKFYPSFDNAMIDYSILSIKHVEKRISVLLDTEANLNSFQKCWWSYKTKSLIIINNVNRFSSRGQSINIEISNHFHPFKSVGFCIDE